MKAYGIPRVLEVEYPDLGDIRRFGFKSSVSRPKNKSGDHKNSFRNSNSKASTRRIWKKKERINSKVSVRSYID